jgi:heat shock protein HtpX
VSLENRGRHLHIFVIESLSNIMTRIFLFIATNIAVIALISIVFQILGLEGILAENGADLNLTALMVMSAVIGFGGSFISLAISKWMAKRSMKVQVIQNPSNPTERWLMDTVARQAQQAGIAMPEVGIFPSESVNAFATGMRRNAALVAVSSGLLNQMTQDEAEAVMAHEISHVANGDMVTLTLIQGVVNTFVMFFARIIGGFVDRVIFKNDSGSPGFGFIIATIFAEIVLGILASIIVMWFSRQREFRADAASAQLAGTGNMIAALEHLRAEQGQPVELPGEMTAFGINGNLRGGLAALLMTHPPLEERIAALRSANR